jgi:hypothetical protein
MTKSRGIQGPRAVWTDEQLAMLRDFYPRFRAEDVAFMIGHSLGQVHTKARSLGLEKTAGFMESSASGRLDGERGSRTRFQKGHAAPSGAGKALAAAGVATRFKPGQSAHNAMPIGSYRVSSDGYLQRKVSNASGSNDKRWRSVHELVWIELNGPVPDKHIVIFKPGMRTTVLEEITIDRVECISLVENMRRNTLHNYPPAIVQVTLLRARLVRQINKRSTG